MWLEWNYVLYVEWCFCVVNVLECWNLGLEGGWCCCVYCWGVLCVVCVCCIGVVVDEVGDYCVDYWGNEVWVFGNCYWCVWFFVDVGWNCCVWSVVCFLFGGWYCVIVFGIFVDDFNVVELNIVSGGMFNGGSLWICCCGWMYCCWMNIECENRYEGVVYWVLMFYFFCVCCDVCGIVVGVVW